MYPSRVRRLCALAALVVAGAITSPAAISPNVVISEFRVRGPNGAADEFVELFNTGSSAVNIGGWKINGSNNAGTTSTRATISANVILGPGCFYLVTNSSASGGPYSGAVAGNQTFTTGITDDGGIALLRADNSVVDQVGMSNGSAYKEGVVLAPLSTTTAGNVNRSYERKPGGAAGHADTDSNNADFQALAPSNPQNLSSPCISGNPSGVGTATPASVFTGEQSLLTIAVTAGKFPASTGLEVVANLAAIGGSATQTFYDDGSNGDASPGDQVFSYLAIVTGLAGPKAVPFTVTDDQDRSTTGSFSVDIASPPLPIHDLQGPGPVSPYAGGSATTTGVVTARKTNGFFLQMQDSDVDANPMTSEGIFVFTSSTPGVLVGDLVTVRGTVAEFFSMTELDTTRPGDVTVLSSGNPLPAAVTLTESILAPSGATTQRERFEGMRLHADTLVSVGPTNEFGEVLTVLPGVPRPMREPGIEISNPVPPDPVTLATDCCIPRWDENPERLMIDTDGRAGAAVLSVTSNVVLSNVTGPLDFTFGSYKLVPETTPAASPNMGAVAVPAPGANEFTVAGFNIENFAGNATQRAKAALAIRTVMRLPDIIGHIEIGSLAALQGLADRVNSDTIAATGTNPMYEAFLVPFTGTQHVGFLVKRSRVQVNSVTQERTTDTFVNPSSGATETLHDRPPLVLKATIDPLGANPGEVIVVVNHLRSFIDIELVAGEGPRVRAKRTAQAEAIAQLLQQLQSENPNVPVISVGDYNAFQFNDGYTDPISILKGAPTPTSQVVAQQSPDLVEPNFVNLTDTLPAADQYSFIFEGTPQALDHVLLNTVAARYLQRYAVARANADFPDTAAWTRDASRPERSSDHDMPVAYFAFPGTPVVTLNGSATMTVEAFTPFVDPGATAHDDFGALPVTVTGTVDVNVPGEYELAYTATNGYKTTAVTRTIRVVDTTPPAITGLTVTPDVLAVPNHKMIEVGVPYIATDGAGTPACTVSIASNQAPDALGDGHTGNDWRVLGPHAALLRAERSGQGNGRVYTLTVTCTDASGNAASGSATVVVPKGK